MTKVGFREDLIGGDSVRVEGILVEVNEGKSLLRSLIAGTSTSFAIPTPTRIVEKINSGNLTT